MWLEEARGNTQTRGATVKSWGPPGPPAERREAISGASSPPIIFITEIAIRPSRGADDDDDNSHMRQTNDSILRYKRLVTVIADAHFSHARCVGQDTPGLEASFVLFQSKPATSVVIIYSSTPAGSGMAL